jgi:hypothetical protein
MVRFLCRGTGLLAILCLLAPTASADCARDAYGEVYCGAGRCTLDRNGTVWCSRYYEGGVERTRDGVVVCGKGQCAKNSRGQIFCSSVVGGSVLKDSQGRVRCYGRCEHPSVAQCENTRADAGE